MKKRVALSLLPLIVFIGAAFNSCSTTPASSSLESINSGGSGTSNAAPFRMNIDILRPTMGQSDGCTYNDCTSVTFSVTVTNMGNDINSNYCSPPVLKLCRSSNGGLLYQDVINQYPLAVIPADKAIPELSSYTFWFSNINISDNIGSNYFYLYFDCFDLNNHRLTNVVNTSSSLWLQVNFLPFTVSPFQLNFQAWPVSVSIPPSCGLNDHTSISAGVTYANYGSTISSNLCTMPQFVLCQSSKSNLTYMDFINNIYGFSGMSYTLPQQKINSGSTVTVNFNDFDISTIAGTNYFYIFAHLYNTVGGGLLTNSQTNLDKEMVQLNSTPLIVN